MKFLLVDAIETTRELMDSTRRERVQYYQQTASAFFEGLARCRIDSGLKVVEIGAERTYWKLRFLRDLCTEAYALNIFFHFTAESASRDWPQRVLGDMNDMPFVDGYFDLVICSATLHHSSDIGGALKEIDRILRPGGRAIVVNEPVAGIAKWMGGRAGHSRDEHIHEDPVSFRHWRRAIRKSGLKGDHFVPAWFLGEVRDAMRLPEGTRFRGLARAIAPLANHSTLADLFRTLGRVPGQAVLGLPLNAVLWKSEREPSPDRAFGAHHEEHLGVRNEGPPTPGTPELTPPAGARLASASDT